MMARIEEMFEVVPIKGMEMVQKNFHKYRDSNETIRKMFRGSESVSSPALSMHSNITACNFC